MGENRSRSTSDYVGTSSPQIRIIDFFTHLGCLLQFLDTRYLSVTAWRTWPTRPRSST
jgi:hypothetical protein